MHVHFKFWKGMCIAKQKARGDLPSWGCLLWWWRPNQSAAGPEC